MVLATRGTDQWKRTESPVTDTHIYSSLIAFYCNAIKDGLSVSCTGQLAIHPPKYAAWPLLHSILITFRSKCQR